jgi:hypothetical protein
MSLGRGPVGNPWTANSFVFCSCSTILGKLLLSMTASSQLCFVAKLDDVASGADPHKIGPLTRRTGGFTG